MGVIVVFTSCSWVLLHERHKELRPAPGRCHLEDSLHSEQREVGEGIDWHCHCHWSSLLLVRVGIIMVKLYLVLFPR